jgi:short-subunit dehydrogenase
MERGKYIMKHVHGNVVLVTGASSGIGKSIAEYLMKNGFKVYGTSRNVPDGNGKLIATEGEGFIKLVQLDVCNEASIIKAVNYVTSQEGRIDILINNAGYGIAGSVEDTDPSEAFGQFDTNFFGVHRMCRNVIPVMRSQKQGLIINVSSVAGLISIPYQSMYSASKYALEAMTEAMRIELSQFGIKVSLVEPGDTKTGFTGSRQNVKAANQDSAYHNKFTKSIETMAKSEMNGPDPIIVAKASPSFLDT